MPYLTQKTIKSPISFNGITLHSGLNVNVVIKPAIPNTGIVFKRIDVKLNNLIYPNFMNVSNTSLNTTIENEFGVKVSTIEHLMGALFGLGIDNILVEINNEEVPILDGSARIFTQKIKDAGIEVSNEPIKVIKIKNKEIEYSDGERFIRIKPSTLSLDIDFELKYKNKVIGNQRNKFKIYEDDLTDVYNSRTYCLYEDIEIIKNGLAKGGSLDNAVVVKDEKILNSGGLRNSKEFVNHKILDCIGDLYTCGYRIVGSVICSQGGHYLTNKLLRKIFKSKENFSILEIKEKNLPHNLINKTLLRSIA